MNAIDKKQFWKDIKSGALANMIKEAAPGKALSNADEVYNTMKPVFAQEDDVEKMYIIYLNAKNRTKKMEEFSRGTLTASAVYPRELVKKVIKYKAAAIIMVHNHPSDDTQPSREDMELTKHIVFLMKLIGVTVHEHLIVGDGYYSMADQGHIARFKSQLHERW